MSKLNAEIREAIEATHLDNAKKLLSEALADADAETYYLASQVALDDDQKRDFLEKALELDPFHSKAYKAKKALSAEVQPTDTSPLSGIAPSPLESPHSTTDQKVPQSRQSSINAWGIPNSPAETSASEPASNTPLSKQKTEIVEEPKLKPKIPSGPIQVTVTNPDTYMYTIPKQQRRKRESLRSGTTLDVIARGHDPDWLNVGYNEHGSKKVGWIQVSDVSKPRQRGGDEWSFDDLPITYYQYNTSKELDEIKKYIAQSAGSQGIVFGAVVLAFFVFIIATTGSENWGVIFGSLIGAGLIIGSLYMRANNIASHIHQIHTIERLKTNAPKSIPNRYIPYTGWSYPMPEQIEQADSDYESDRQRARRKAIQWGGGFVLFAGIWMGILMISEPSEGSVDFAVGVISFVSLFIAWPIVSYLAVYATDEEKALALAGVAILGTAFVGAATKTKGGAIQRRKDREAEAARIRAEAERKRKEAEAKRKAEAERKRKEEDQRQQAQQQAASRSNRQALEHQSTYRYEYEGASFDSRGDRDQFKMWLDGAAMQQEQEWNASHGFE